ncbi:cyclic nucleotide-binding/CBS domain-containing protein [Oceaniovalibus sp. ACAM 378]|uniref:CBS domain-containing protein n=1 Tax=Oceaniovalibus sp. ACAM 378 TaxID=2599923 RepID=UPI0011D3FD83|nr:CBS domain-containing protein [Oceaniovalibus sp. ACAM 378]TYB91220.1 CBS domain-containing protein [Oceaniovalibus sp. ACAM 378]
MLVEKILPDIRKRLLCIKPHETLLQAAGLLDNGSDMLLVCDDARQLAGIITKTDVVRMIRRCSGASCTAPVTDAMTRDALTTTPKAWLHEAWKLMRVKGLKNLPVLDVDGSVLGILNARDALQTLLQETRNEEELLRDYAMNIGYR